MLETTIVFACRQNAGRSQIAAAYARALAGTGVRILSAGTTPADAVHPETTATLAEVDLAAEENPRLLDTEVLQAADWVITMGCGESCPIYPGKHYEDWPVADPAGQSLEKVREIREDIAARVRDLLERIERIRNEGN